MVMLKRIYFSNSTGGFYFEEDRQAYESADAWPGDAVAVSEKDYLKFRGPSPAGKRPASGDGGKMLYEDMPEPVVDPVVVAKGTKRQLLAEAREKIAILQDAVDLGMATEDEKFQLIEWKKYRVLLTRIKPEDAPEIEWPDKPE